MKKFFGALGPQFGLKIRWGAQHPPPPGPSPGSAAGFFPLMLLVFFVCNSVRIGQNLPNEVQVKKIYPL